MKLLQQYRVYQLDAFTDEPFAGNPAAVVVCPQWPSEDEMQKVAAEMNCSETAFVLKGTAEDAEDGIDYYVRYFTPTQEVELCGHATVAVWYALVIEGMVFAEKDGSVIWHQKTKAGVLPIELTFADNDLIRVMMDQTTPIYGNDIADLSALAGILGIAAENIGCRGIAPKVVSTGLYDLLLPVASKKILDSITPDMLALADFQQKHDFISVHAFSFGDDGQLYARDFAPSVGIDEESATGTANCALAAYLTDCGVLPIVGGVAGLCVIQGYNMGRTSQIETEIHLDAAGEIVRTRVGGQAAAILCGGLRF